jgi:hypothetical protein
MHSFTKCRTHPVLFDAPTGARTGLTRDGDRSSLGDRSNLTWR